MSVWVSEYDNIISITNIRQVQIWELLFMHVCLFVLEELLNISASLSICS